MSDTAIRLFVSDIDGTLVRHDKSLSDGNVAAARRLTAAGIAMSLISARPPSGMRWIAERIGLPGPFAAFNGGTLFDHDGIIAAEHVPDELAAQCLAIFARRAEPWVFAQAKWYARTGEGEHPARERKAAGIEPEVVADLAPFAHAVDKLVAVSDDDAALTAIEHEVRAVAGSRATIMRSQTYYLDITAPSANKGDGLAALAARFGVPLDQVAVAGDMDNDLPMFARAGLSFAMGQAPERVRVKADRVSAGNEDDGVARAIDELLAGRH